MSIFKKFAILGLALITIGIILWAYLIVGPATPVKLEPQFEIGEKVRSVLTGAPGQVIDTSYCKCDGIWRYKVRFGVSSVTTNTKLFADDDPITVAPLSSMWLHEFELEAIKKR